VKSILANKNVSKARWVRQKIFVERKNRKGRAKWRSELASGHLWAGSFLGKFLNSTCQRGTVTKGKRKAVRGKKRVGRKKEGGGNEEGNERRLGKNRSMQRQNPVNQKEEKRTEGKNERKGVRRVILGRSVEALFKNESKKKKRERRGSAPRKGEGGKQEKKKGKKSNFDATTSRCPEWGTQAHGTEGCR